MAATLIALLGYEIVIFTLAGTLKENPSHAHALAPYDERGTARLAAALSVPGASSKDRRRGENLALTALRQGATSVTAASTLGINAQGRGDLATARRAFAYAERLSRRDLPSQLWAIEDAVSQGDVKGALRHYDIVLRVKPAMWELLFPVLTAAVSQSAIQQELIRTLVSRPPWADGFLNYAAANSANPRDMAAFFLKLHKNGFDEPGSAQASLITALFTRDDVGSAWAFYEHVRPRVTPSQVRDPQFTNPVKSPTLFDWLVVADNGLVGTIEGGAFYFSAPSSLGGTLIRQEQILSPGSYFLTGHSADLDQPRETQPYWTLTCRGGHELGRVDVPSSSKDNGEFAGRLHVPPNCPVQTLSLVARPSDAVDGLSGRIDWIRLDRMR